MESGVYSCYIVRCSDGTYYCGISNDVTRRILVHNSGRGSKYVRGRLPVVLVYVERCGNKSDALRREYEIKRMSRLQKGVLIGMCDKNKT
jgi:putative endonuclease